MENNRFSLGLCFKKPVFQTWDGLFVIGTPRFWSRVTLFVTPVILFAVSVGLSYWITPWGIAASRTEFYANATYILFLSGIPTALILALKPAWSRKVKVFPLEGIARRRRYWFGIPFSSRWYEIGNAQAGFEIKTLSVKIKQSPKNPGGVGLGCLLLLLGPAGTLIGMLLPKKKRPSKQLLIYALFCHLGRDEGHEPIAYFLREVDAVSALDVVERSVF